MTKPCTQCGRQDAVATNWLIRINTNGEVTMRLCPACRREKYDPLHQRHIVPKEPNPRRYPL